MENIPLSGLFGFDMNDFYKDSALAMDIELRSKLFWLDIVKILGSAEDSIIAMNRFIELARRILNKNI